MDSYSRHVSKRSHTIRPTRYPQQRPPTLKREEAFRLQRWEVEIVEASLKLESRSRHKCSLWHPQAVMYKLPWNLQWPCTPIDKEYCTGHSIPLAATSTEHLRLRSYCRSFRVLDPRQSWFDHPRAIDSSRPRLFLPLFPLSVLFTSFRFLFPYLNIVTVFLPVSWLFFVFALHHFLIPPFWALSFLSMYTILIISFISFMLSWKRWRIGCWSSPHRWIVAVEEYGRPLVAFSLFFCFLFHFSRLPMPSSSPLPPSRRHLNSIFLDTHIQPLTTIFMYNTITMLYHFLIFLRVDIWFHRTLKSSNCNQMAQRKLKSVNIIYLIILLSCYSSSAITMTDYNLWWHCNVSRAPKLYLD